MTKGNISWASLLTAVDTPALNCPYLLLVIKVLFKKLMRAGTNPKKSSYCLAKYWLQVARPPIQCSPSKCSNRLITIHKCLEIIFFREIFSHNLDPAKIYKLANI